MKKMLYILVIALFSSISAIAQTNVKLDINHLQGSQNLAILQPSTTGGGESYNATRLEYYMAEFKLEHDGGSITEIDSFWVLVNGFIPSIIDLGQYNITNLEAIHFSIGVEQPVNHQDPSKWPNGHPLSPKSPSMHWGWAAGYRFFAMEGKCGSSLPYTYEFHCLGDNYYYQQRIETAGSDDNGDLLVTLNADYDKVWESITLGTGLIEHGEFPLNIQFLQNVRDFVFTSEEGNRNSLSPVVGIEEATLQNVIEVYPNPSSVGKVFVKSTEDLSGSVLRVNDLSGRLITEEFINEFRGVTELEIPTNGFYLLQIVRDNNVLARKQIIVKK